MNTNTLNKTKYSIYIIELDKKILELKKFRDANLAYNPEKPCIYIGYTSKTPEKRFEQHISGAKSKKGVSVYSRKVKKYGIRLKPRLYKSHNPMKTQEEAEAMEIEKARRLRKRGYGVWQN